MTVSRLVMQNGGRTDKRTKRSRRTEDIDVIFSNGLATGWVFEVHECFKTALDILYSQYVDKEESKRQERKVYRMVWTRGVPPVRSFGVGDVFYDPPGVGRMVWEDALKVINRSVQIAEVKADQETGEQGWVRFTISYYQNQRITRTEEHTLSQAQFEGFLRTGNVGGAP